MATEDTVPVPKPSDASCEPTLSAARLALAVRRARTQAGDSAHLLLSEPIAIIGMGCRFPGSVENPAQYWQLLAEGRSGIREIPHGRWADADDIPPHLRMGGYLENVDLFDPEFFNISPREAPSLDPQQRLLLEVCWQALADAEIAPSALSGTDTGIFLAEYNNDYARLMMTSDAAIDAYSGVGTAHSVSAGRVSFLLNLRGPSIAVDTACSSSLVATHLACESLRRRESTIALVAASSLKLLSEEARTFAAWGMLARDGRAKTFDAAADGFVPGEGCGVLVLKRLSDAIAHGDRIRAVLRGSAVNHDGRSSVLTAPNGPAQEAVIRSALRDARVRPADVSFIETHGTGTPLGDPIEVEALDAVYGNADSSSAPCVLGAVKTNFGHLEAAAGIAGLIKTVLSLEQETIPSNLNFEKINPQIRLASGSRLRLANAAKPWPRSQQSRFAGVSSFGIGGTNAHVLIEEAPLLPKLPGTAEGRDQAVDFCVPISSHTRHGLQSLLASYISLLREPGADISRVARSAARGRDHAAFRISVTGSNATEVADKLETKILQLDGVGTDIPTLHETPRKPWFVFSGQGSGWAGMMDSLLGLSPVADKLLSSCEQLVSKAAGWSIQELARDPSALNDTAKGQPILFVLQVMLVEILREWGIHPEGVIGHSAGEIGAAATAGVLSVEQGLSLALKRGLRMAAADAGKMLAAEMSVDQGVALIAAMQEQAPSAITSLPELAAENAPDAIVFSGETSGMDSLFARLTAQGIATRWLDVPYAFHSATMRAASEALRSELLAAHSTFASSSKPSIAFISTVTGKAWNTSSDQNPDGSPGYWARGVRRPVQFRKALDTALDSGCQMVLEIGPHPVLLRSILACAAASSHSHKSVRTFASMRRGQSGRATLLSAAGALYEAGHELRWSRIYPGPPAHVALPPYPWNRQRYWLPAASAPQPLPSKPSHQGSLLGPELPSAFLRGRLFSSFLSTTAFPWLAEHVVNDRPILPFAAWIDLACAAILAVRPQSEAGVDEFAVHKSLEIPAAGVALQILVEQSGEIRIAALLENKWETFASGYASSMTIETPSDQPRCAPDLTSAVSFEEWKRRSTGSHNPQELLSQMRAKGLIHGPAFQLLTQVESGPGFALGRVTGLPKAEPSNSSPSLHPTLLDACLQTLQAALPESHRHQPMLPVSVSRHRVLRGADDLFVLATLLSVDLDSATADLILANKQGELVAEIKGMRVRSIPSAAAPSSSLSPTPSPLWRNFWVEVERSEVKPMKGPANHWTIALDSVDPVNSRLLESIASRLESSGDPVSRKNGVALSPIPSSSRTGPLNLVLTGNFNTVLTNILAATHLEQSDPGTVQQICILTRGAFQAIDSESVDPSQAALLGLARSFRAEYPAIAVRLVDLPMGSPASVELNLVANPESYQPPAGIASIEIEQVVQCLRSQVGGAVGLTSSEIALRAGRFYRPRLQSYLPLDHALVQSQLSPASPGLLESLHLQRVITPDPQPGQVQIECVAHGLNFRDVLTALGSYAGTAAPLGAECSGMILKAGSSTSLQPGTRVAAFAPASLRSVVNVDSSFVVAIPPNMSFAEAASIPVAFLTAQYALSEIAKLQSGQTVLIHSAAGGLGQAALQLAHRAGASIIATAGSAAKRAFLQAQSIELGITHIFDSHSELFADNVLDATDGRGVDVILNALSGAKVDASFKALSEGGVFIEVGKRNIWTLEQAAQRRPDARYFPFDLGEVAQRDPALLARMLGEIFAGFASDALHLIARELYPIAEAESAFRKMASGRHVGKLVLMQPPLELLKSRWLGALIEGTVLITGGTGALGLSAARWLLQQRAKSLVLVSRRGDPSLAQKLEAEFAGCHVTVNHADVSSRDELASVLTGIRQSNRAPLRVIIHAAGETHDALLADQSLERFNKAMQVKAASAHLLEELTVGDRVTATLYYSSLTAQIGSAGQSSYAAANAYLDGLAAQRNARGLRTLSVNWGAWADGGMVSRLSSPAVARLVRQGIQPMPPASALAALELALLHGLSSITIADVDWQAIQSQFPLKSPASQFFEAYLPQADSPWTTSTSEPPPVTDDVPVIATILSTNDELSAIRNASRSERQPLTETLIRNQARKVLGLSANRPMPAEIPLQELGLDSLMALELRNLLSHSLGRPLSATLLFDYPTIRGLAKFLLTKLEPAKEYSANQLPSAQPKPVDQNLSTVLDSSDLVEMSDSEAEELLLAELDGKRRS